MKQSTEPSRNTPPIEHDKNADCTHVVAYMYKSTPWLLQRLQRELVMRGRGKKTTKRGPSKAKRCATITVDDTSVEAIADPWIGLRSPLGGKLSPAEEWKRLHDTAYRGRELVLLADGISQAVLQAPTPEAFRSATRVSATEQAKTNSPRDDNGGETEIAVRVPEGGKPVERLVILRQNLPLVSTVCARRLLAAGLVRLDVRGIELGDAGLDTIMAWTPWLRELSAAGNGLTRVPLLRGSEKLQWLDLARNKIQSLPPGCFPPELGPTLRMLSLEGNRLGRLDFPLTPDEDAQANAQQEKQQEKQQQLQHAQEQSPRVGVAAGSRVGSPLHALTSLVDLNLANNTFDARSAGRSLAVFTKSGFPRLVKLDLRGNYLPGEEERRFLHRISTGIPTLRTLNGEDVSRGAMKVSSKEPMFELLSTEFAGDQCTKEGRRQESCSCMEGNPCVVAYNCRDWANRFEVATAAAASGSCNK